MSNTPEIIAWAKGISKISVSVGWDAYTTQVIGGQEYEITIDNSSALEAIYLDDIRSRLNTFIGQAEKNGFTAAEAEREFIRELCKRDLYYLTKFVLGYDLCEFHLHYPLAQFAQKINTQKDYRGLIELSRGFFKSTICTIANAIQLMLINPNVAIGFISNSANNADDKLIATKDHFIRNDILRSLFPEYCCQNKKDFGSNSSFVCPASTVRKEEATLMSAGVGTRWSGKHFTHLICDDFWDDVSVTTPDVLSKCKTAIHELPFILRRNGAILFVATRYSHDDPTTMLQKHSQYGKNCIIRSAIDDQGQATFPSQRSLESLMADDEQSRYSFSCQMMLNPSAESQAFNERWFRYMPHEEQERQRQEGELRYRTLILTDYAGTDGKTADNFALLVVRADSLGRYVVCELIKEQMSPNDAIDETYRMADKWSADMLVRQKAPLESALKSFMDDAQTRRRADGHKYYHWKEFSLHRQQKQSRMLALQPLFQQGMIYFQPLSSDESMKDLQEEVLSFPFNMTNDDLMDALSELCDPDIGEFPVFTAKPDEISRQQSQIQYLDHHRDAEIKQRRQSVEKYFSKFKKPT